MDGLMLQYAFMTSSSSIMLFVLLLALFQTRSVFALPFSLKKTQTISNNIHKNTNQHSLQLRSLSSLSSSSDGDKVDTYQSQELIPTSPQRPQDFSQKRETSLNVITEPLKVMSKYFST